MIKAVKFIIACTLATVSLKSYGQTIFEPNDKICQPYFGGSFKFCVAQPVEISMVRITETKIDLLKDLPVENSLSYKLFCPSWPDSQPVDFKSNNRSQTLLASSKAMAESVKEVVSNSDLVNSKYVFTPNLKREATIYADCKMEVISNSTVPNIAFLQVISKLMKDDLSVLNDLRSKLEKSSELPAKWSAIIASTQTLEDSASSIDFEKTQFESELQELSVLSESELSTEDSSRKEILPSIIETYTLISANLRTAKNDISEILKIADKCDTNNPDSSCIKAVDAVSVLMTAKYEENKKKAKDFAEFLSKESQRLKDSAKRLSKQLSDLATQVLP